MGLRLSYDNSVICYVLTLWANLVGKNEPQHHTPYRRKYILWEKFDSATSGLQRNKDLILSLKRGFISVNGKKVGKVNIGKRKFIFFSEIF